MNNKRKSDSVPAKAKRAKMDEKSLAEIQPFLTIYEYLNQ